MKVLIAEDDPVSRHVLQAFLIKWGYEVVVACDGAEAWNVLQQEDAPKFAILDWMMPAVDGVELCGKIRKRAEQPYVYIILLTAKGRRQDVIEGLETGADDYLTKPFDAQELRARVRAGRRILDLQDELICTQEALRSQATHDDLTGLWNRREMLDIMRRELARAHREGTSTGLLMADLDHFKRVNDTYGHLAGDAVLIAAARRMRRSVRPYDAIGRYGGEEFLIVLPGCDAADAIQQAERLRACVSVEPMETVEGKIPVTLSLGVAAVESGTEADLDSLLRTVDAALYRAKNEGRNRVELAVKAAVGCGEHLPERRTTTRNIETREDVAPRSTLET